MTNVCLVVLLVFACAAMCTIMMDLGPPVLQSFIGDTWLLHRVPVGLYMTAVMFPLSIQKSINVLRYTSFLALACIGYFFVCLVVEFCKDPHIDHSVSAVGPPGKIMDGLPIMFSAFLCQFNIFKIDHELREQDRTKITKVILIAVPGMAATIYVCGGLIGYFLLGATVANNILKDFEGDLKFTIARGMLSLTNMFKVPLLMIPLRESVIEMIGLDKEVWNQFGRRFLMTLLMNSLCFLLACLLESLSKVLGLVGCTTGVLIAFVLPGFMYLEHLRRVETASGSVLHSFSNISALGSLNAGTEQRSLTTHSQTTLWTRKAPAWVLIVASIAVGASSLVAMIADWKDA